MQVQGYVSAGWLTDAVFQDASHAFGLADLKGHTIVAVTSDGGHSWRSVPSPPLSRGMNEPAIGAWGGLEAIWGRSGLVLSTDHGERWTRVLNGIVGQVSASGPDIWATVADCGQLVTAQPAGCPAKLEVSPDNGHHWSVRSELPAGVIPGTWVENSGSHALIRTGPTSAYLLDAIHRGVILVTHDGGRTWTRRPGPCPASLDFDSGWFYAFGAVGQDVWLACGGEPSAGWQAKALYVSTDAAQTWHRVAVARPGGGTLPSGYLSGLSITGPGTAYLVLLRHQLMQTHDGGVTWYDAAREGAAQHAFENADRVSLTTLGPERAWALLDVAPYLWTTTDGGAHWTPVTQRRH